MTPFADTEAKVRFRRLDPADDWLIAKSFNESPRYGRMTRGAPMTVREKVRRFAGQHIVEIDTDIRKLAKDC